MTRGKPIDDSPARGRALPAYAAVAGVVAAAGIPLYIHLPAFLAARYGIALEALGGLLLALRLVDVVQDPALGWVLARLGRWRGLAVAASGGALGLGMVGLFAVPAPVAPLGWVAACLVLTFTGFSALSILVYADGVGRGAGSGHVRVAAWREAGALTGITAACLAPFALPGDGYAGFALGFAAALGLALLAMRGRWLAVSAAPVPLRGLLADRTVRRFLLLAFLNAAPVAVTSTLFVFFVDARLGLPDLAGPFLVLFFLAAALSTPAWRLAAARFGARRALVAGMLLAMASFAWAYGLGPGDGLAFAAICLASGAALGADMMLLPALFSASQARRGAAGAALAFGFWAFAGKATLAIAAGVVLPLLAWSGFAPAGPHGPEALAALSLLYALLPIGLKLAALALLVFALDEAEA